MSTYEKPPLTRPSMEQLGIADTAVDRELSTLEDEENIACIDMASTHDPLRNLFGPSDPSPATPSPVLPGLPSPSAHAYEKGVADISIDSVSYPNAPPPTPQANSDRVAKPGHPASRNTAEKALASAALKTSQHARKLADKVNLIDHTLTAIQMRMENDRMLSGLLPRLGRDVVEKSLTKFYKSRSDVYRGTLAGHSSVEHDLLLEVRQLQDAIHADRISGALPSPGCGVDLVQRMEDVEIESSRERKRELTAIEKELAEVDRDMAKSADNLSESSLKQLGHTKERYNQLRRLHLENQRHKEQQLKEQRIREQQMIEQRHRVQQLEGHNVTEQQLPVQQLRDQRMQSDSRLEQSLKAMNIHEPRQGNFQGRELTRRMSTGDRLLHVLEGHHRGPRALHNGVGAATGKAGPGAFPNSREPIVSSGHYADPATNYPGPSTSARHPNDGLNVLRPGAILTQPVRQNSSERVNGEAPRQVTPNLPPHQQYPHVVRDRRAFQTPSSGMAPNEPLYLDFQKPSQLPKRPQPPLPHVVHPVPQDYSFQAPYSHQARVPENHLVVGANQQHFPSQNGRALAAGSRDLSHQRPPLEYAIGRPHSLTANPVSQVPYEYVGPPPQSGDSYPYIADGYQPHRSADHSDYPPGTYYEENDLPHAQHDYHEQETLPAESSQLSTGNANPTFNSRSRPVARLASNETKGPPHPYGGSRGFIRGAAGPSGNVNYFPARGRPPTSMYPVNREVQTWNTEGENHSSERQQIPVHHTPRTAPTATGSQSERSRATSEPSQPSANYSHGEESMASYGQVRKGPKEYEEGTITGQRLSNHHARPEVTRHGSSSYQDYLHVGQGRADGREQGRDVPTGIIGGVQCHGGAPGRYSTDFVRRAGSDIPPEAILFEQRRFASQGPDLSQFGALPQVQMVSNANYGAKQQTSSLVREGVLPSLSMPQPPASLAQDMGLRAEKQPNSDQRTLQSMVNAFSNA